MTTPADSPAKVPAVPEGASAAKRRRAIGTIECRLGVLLGVAALICSRLGQLWVAFDVFAQFTLQFAVVTAAFLIALVFRRAKLFVAFLFIVVGLLAIGVWPHVASRMPETFAPAGPGELELRVASFNTLWVNNDAEAVKAEVLRLDADVITLIEMAESKRRIIAEVKDRYPYHADCYDIAFCNFVVLSKFPIVSFDAKALWKGPPYIRATLGPEAGGLTVFGVHTIRFPHSRAQFRQANVIADVIEKVPGQKLVMGDFNATPFSRIVGTVTNRANLVRLTSLPSWPSYVGLPQIAIDHIFVSHGIRLVEGQTIGEPAGSDHFPVTLRIAVKRQP